MSRILNQTQDETGTLPAEMLVAVSLFERRHCGAEITKPGGQEKSEIQSLPAAQTYSERCVRRPSEHHNRTAAPFTYEIACLASVMSKTNTASPGRQTPQKAAGQHLVETHHLHANRFLTNHHIEETTMTRAQAQTKTNDAKPITLQSIAHRMMTEASGDIEAAARKIFNYCGNYPRLADELGMMAARNLAQQVPIAARQQATTARADQPPHIFTTAVHAAQRRARRMGVSNSNALLNDPYVINGQSKPLRDWRGDEIREHGEQQLARGKTQMRNAQFLILVGAAAGADVIGKKLDEAMVAQMRAEADELA